MTPAEFLGERTLERLAELGYAVVSIDPTPAMKTAGFAASPHDVGGCRDQIVSDDEWMEEAVLAPYKAMVAAA